ncbi:MAG: LEA type 2 family protein [Gemmatimonadota bacterium]
MRGSRQAVLVALAALVACVPKVQQPDVWLSGARLVSLGFAGGVIDVELGVYNPNSFVVRTGELTYDLDFADPDGDGWLDFAEGTIREDLRVAAGDTANVVVPVEFGYGSLGGALRALLDRGSFDYRVTGAIAVEEPIMRDIGYRHTGTVTPNGVR